MTGKKPSKITIKDIAKRAGVSIATVSYVINNTRHVSDELKKRIITVMEEVDYQPNRAAGSLRKKSTNTIGLIVPDISNPIYAELSRIIEDCLSSRGFTIILSNSEHNLKKEISSITMLRTMRVDGFIIIPASSDNNHINKLVKSDVPMVILDRPVEGIIADGVFIDHYKAVFDATAYLANLNHKNIGYIDKSFNVPHKSHRLDGYRAALKKHRLEYNKNLHIEVGVSFEDGARAMEILLQKNPRPTAVIAFDDVIAMGAIRTCHDHRLDIPGDISIMGFDDMPLCLYTVPRLSTICYPRYRMAETACSMLLERINDEDNRKKQEVTLPLDLVIRETTSLNKP